MTAEEFKQYRLADVLTPVSRPVHVKPAGEYRLLGVRWYGNGCRLHSESRGSELKTKKLFRVEAADIVYNKMWTTKSAFAVVDDRHSGLVATSEYPAFIANRQKLDPSFFRYVMVSPAFGEMASAACRGSTSRARLNPKDFLGLRVRLPPLSEQRKIAAILSSVDEVIEKTEAVIEQLQVVKKTMMQELLTRGIPGRHTRFKQTEIGEIPEEWELVSLGDVIRSIDAGWSPKCDSEPAAINEWGVLKTTSVVWDGWDETQQKRLPSQLEPRPDMEVMADDVLVTRAGPVERVGVVVHVPAARRKLMISDKIIRVRSNEQRVRPAYLSLALASAGPQAHLIRRKSGLAASQVNISQEILQSCPLPLPSVEEQERIVPVLAGVQDTFRAEEATLAATCKVKAALMSVLLTGEVRVTSDEESA